MKKKILLSFILVFAVVIILSILRRDTYQKDIASIYTYSSSFGVRGLEYFYDLENKECWKFVSGDMEEERDNTLENEGYTFVCSLLDERIDQFLKNSARYGFTNWKDSYDDESIMDGEQWGMTIIFADGSKKEIYGSNDYPITYDMMQENFKYLRGEKVY